jgi:hypothetical protein
VRDVLVGEGEGEGRCRDGSDFGGGELYALVHVVFGGDRRL